MKPALPLWARCALVLPLASAAAAQTLPDAANPDAQVPPATYRSAFADTATGVERERSDWKKANADVGQFRRGHVDLLKWEDQHSPSSQPSPTAGPAGGPPPRPASNPAGHRH